MPGAAVDAATELVDRPSSGRVHTGSARVRLGDVDPGGRQRLDALARVVQDAANDDAVDAFGAPGGEPGDEVMAWVVRRSLIEVAVPARFREQLEVATWCGGLGSRWAERRVSITGDRGARVEVAMLWVHLDPVRGTPVRPSPAFVERYGEAAGGRQVRARLRHPGPEPARTGRPWPLRATDVDLLDHVNNAVHLAVVEDELAHHPDRGGPVRVEVEYRRPIEPKDEPVVTVEERPDGFALWLLVGDVVAASATVATIDPG